MLTSVSTFAAFCFASAIAAPSPRIVGGESTKACHFPSAVLIYHDHGRTAACTGTLVHPEIVTTAGHCVAQDMVFGFGERGQHRLVTGSCKASPEHLDMAYCKLNRAVTGVPIVPVLMGCELEALQKGLEVALVGFGNSGDQSADGGIKRQVMTPVHAPMGEGGVEDEEILLGHADKGSCNGDSGGPAYIDLRTVSAFSNKPGAGWRAFGVTSRKGPGGSNCASTTVYGVIAKMVPWIEEDSGIDITPCFDSDGTWNPGADCKDFPDPKAGGEWLNCEQGDLSPPSQTCAGLPQNSTQGDPPDSTTTQVETITTEAPPSQGNEDPPPKKSGCAMQDTPLRGWLGLGVLWGLCRSRRRASR